MSELLLLIIVSVFRVNIDRVAAVILLLQHIINKLAQSEQLFNLNLLITFDLEKKKRKKNINKSIQFSTVKSCDFIILLLLELR